MGTWHLGFASSAGAGCGVVSRLVVDFVGRSLSGCWRHCRLVAGGWWCAEGRGGVDGVGGIGNGNGNGLELRKLLPSLLAVASGWKRRQRKTERARTGKRRCLIGLGGWILQRMTGAARTTSSEKGCLSSPPSGSPSGFYGHSGMGNSMISNRKNTRKSCELRVQWL